jgi:DNA-binding beta-propeller fold protein YncE
VDAAGNLYAADGNAWPKKRDAQGNWSVIAMGGADLGQAFGPAALAVDDAGNLYVADHGFGGVNGRVQEYTAGAGQ